MSARLSRTRLRALVLALKAAALYRCWNGGGGGELGGGEGRPGRRSGGGGGHRRPRVQTFSNRDSLQAFRAVASSTSTGPRSKMSRRSSLFWGRRGQ